MGVYPRYCQQTSYRLDALKKADFLAMPLTPVAPTQDGINVEFKHTMSKINLTIELGSEYEFTQEDVDTKITDVKIDGRLRHFTILILQITILSLIFWSFR